MKKYIIRTLAIILMTAFLPMVSNFCISDFSFSIARASAPSVSDNLVLVDICGQEAIANFDSTNFDLTTKNHNSILPCCVGDTSPGTISLVQFDQIGKFIPILFFTEKPLAKLVFKKIIYHSIIISPPELSAIKATILRI